MHFQKLKAYMDLGRVQGISTTAAVSLVGAFTANRSPDLGILFWLVMIAAFAHSGGAAVNELWDRKLDASLKELSKKPMVTGIISVGEAKTFILLMIAIALALSFFLFGILAFIAITISCIWLVYYCSIGKRTFLSYDFAFGVGYPAYALFGTLAVGWPTDLTWVFLGSVAVVSIFSQWENGLKDADNDRRFGIPSFAVRWGISSKKGLDRSHPYFVYGLCLKIAFLAICTAPILLMEMPVVYIVLVLILGYPVNLYLMWLFVGKQHRTSYVRTILLDVPLSWLLGSAIVIPVGGVLLYIGLFMFVVLGYLIGSVVQSGAEFKFMRYSRQGSVQPDA